MRGLRPKPMPANIPIMMIIRNTKRRMKDMVFPLLYPFPDFWLMK